MMQPGLDDHYLLRALDGKSAPWRYALAFILALFFWIFGAIPEVLLLPSFFGDEATKPVGTLYTFLPGLLGLLFITRFVLGRPAHTIFTAHWPPRWRDYAVGIAIILAVNAIIVICTIPLFGIEYQGFALESRLGGAMIGAMLIGFVIQTAFEEWFFRGLLMQFARRLTSIVPLIILPQALLFAIPHFGNVSSWNGAGIIAVLPYVVVALSWGWIAWRTGSLMMTMGLHFGNNSINTFLLGSRGDLIAPYAPFVQDMPPLPVAVGLSIAQAAVTVAIVEYIVRRRAASAGKGDAQSG